MRLGGSSQATIALFGDRQLDALLLRHADPRLVALAGDENVGQTRGELTVQSILDVDNVEAAQVTLAVRDDTNTTHVAAAGDEANVASVKLDKVNNLASLQIQLDRVVDLDQRVRVADGAAVVGNQEGNALGTKLDLLDLAELVLQDDSDQLNSIQYARHTLASSAPTRWMVKRPLTS